MGQVTRLQVLIGTTAQRIAFTPLEGEFVYDRDLMQVFVGDGVTLGGNTFGAGESNTASNQGAGQGIFKQKTSVDLELYSIGAASSDLTVALSGDVIEVDLSTAIKNAIIANTAKVGNATHTGDASGDTALTLESAAITGKPVATVDGVDLVLISDDDDSGDLKKVTAQSIADLSAGTTDHTALSNIGTNTHAQIDSHIADTSVHFTEASIDITASQVSDFDTEVSNNTDVTTNTAKVSADGSIDTHSDVDTTTTAPTSGDVLEWDGSNFVPSAPSSGVSDHTLLTNIGTNTHAQIDTHISDTTNPHSVTFTQAVSQDAGTDITASEAETLTDGSNANPLHRHPRTFSHVAGGRVILADGQNRARSLISGGFDGTYNFNISGTLIQNTVARVPFDCVLKKVYVWEKKYSGSVSNHDLYIAKREGIVNNSNSSTLVNIFARSMNPYNATREYIWDFEEADELTAGAATFNAGDGILEYFFGTAGANGNVTFTISYLFEEIL